MLTTQVQIPGQVRPVTCVCDDDAFEVGERCLVETDGRVHVATVTRVPLEVPWEEGKSPKAKLLRRASQGDEEREMFAESRRAEWLDYARRRAEELKLELKFVRCDPVSGGKKVNLSFTAEGRVDFRELVRDLSREFKARVELKQIGARDAAVMQGGMGHCGQELCCSRFLTGFAPISMKLAKQQGLPLNPTKISGQCGRLMCCLRYEVGEVSDGGGGCNGGCATKKARH
ncbi:MAG: regulatory iron-sulfur-containing complex subunit RicT [Acidobacteriota bacterium]